ncbi:MAG: transposase [Rubrobacter sp.]|nr:transposase [Rubrobacter sp.]
MAVEGATTAQGIFETYTARRFWCPEPACGTEILVMDNLGAHRPKRIRQLIEQQVCKLVYLPTYSLSTALPQPTP